MTPQTTKVRAGEATTWRAFLATGAPPLLGLISLAVMLHAADGLLAATMMPAIVAEIGGLHLIAWIVMLYEAGSIVAGAASALLVLRFGLRPPLVGAAVLFGIGCAASALAPTTPARAATAILAMGVPLAGLGLLALYRMRRTPPCGPSRSTPGHAPGRSGAGGQLEDPRRPSLGWARRAHGLRRARRDKMAKSFDPETVWRPFGAFSQSVIMGTGQTVYLKGQVSLGQDGEIVGHGDMPAQVDQVLQNIADVLAAMGGRMNDIVSLQQFTTDIQSFMTCGEVRARYFEAPFPVTTTLEVSSLYDPDLLVEITGIAEIPLDRFVMPETAKDKHR
ncbi:MAG: Rid family hydrolase [Pseudomonadota bacterium]